jgi:OFA family oxalate/formate antiporter-like MFS transporter
MAETRVMNRWLVVLGAVLIQLCLGAIYAWSVFTPALIEAGWSKVQTQVVFSLGLVSYAVVMVLAGRLLTVWGPRRLTMAGGLVLGSGYVLAGLLGGSSFPVVLICVGLVGGAGIGLGYVVPIAVGMRWFPDKKGMITGLAVAGFGFGAMGWVKIAGSWGNLLATIGLSGTFIIYGCAFAGLVVLGGMWMAMPPEGWLPKGYTPPENGGKGKGGAVVHAKGAQLLRTYQFYLIFTAFAISAGAGLMSIGLMKLYPMEALQAAGYDAAAANVISGTAMAVFFSVANGLGRIIWGTLSDKLGRRPSLFLMTTTQGLALLGFTVMAGNEYSLYAGAAIIGFNFGGNFSLFPTITADTFGADNVGQNYPFVFLSYGVGGVLGPILGGVLGDMGNFPLAFTICSGLCLLGAFCIAALEPPGKRKKDKPGAA